MRKLFTLRVAAALICTVFSLITNAQNFTDQELKSFLRKNAAQLHILPLDIDNAFVTNSYSDDKTAIRYVYLQQAYQNIKVFNTIISIAIQNGQVLYSSGKFVENLGSKVGTLTRSIEPIDAVDKAAQHLQLPARSGLRLVEDRFSAEKKMIFTPAAIAKRNIATELMWVADEKGLVVKLCWNVNIDVLNSPDWWNVRIDAVSGEFVSKDNWTVNEAKGNQNDFDNGAIQKKENGNDQLEILQSTNQFSPPNVTSGAYNVVKFPLESLNFGSIAVENQPWLKAGAINNATTNGWHFDGTTNYNTTRGNNVYAYEDANFDNTPGATATSTTAAPGLTFNFAPNFSLQPGTTTNQNFALTNLFYWNNLVHDVFYQYGFTEAAGNFQASNLGRGGIGADHVLAESRDGSGVNNANFSTPNDGLNPRMQMYLFSTPFTFTINSPALIAGAYDAVENIFLAPDKLRDLPTSSMTGEVILYNDDVAGTVHLGCAAATNAAQLAGKIALINSSAPCNFIAKAKAAQTAGAAGVIIYRNVDQLVSMTGLDNTITIPAICVGLTTGNQLISQLANGPVTVTMTSGLYLDGDLDNGIVVHEYGHGISTRLTGGPANSSCLNNAEEGGEGWSDFFALMMTTNWTTASLTDGANKRPMGTYALSQTATGSGIRRYPYSTNLAFNPLTYANMATSGEVHDIGEIWCAALWDMTWNIIQQQGSITTDLYNSAGNGGNVIALKLVMEGLKLQTCNPGFIDARNAILAADSLLFNNAHRCAIWKAFARRGMGLSALQGSPYSTTDQTTAFDIPSGVILTKTITPTSILRNAQVTINTTVTCDCQAPLNNYTIRDTIPADFSYVSSTGGSVSGNVVSFTPVSFATSQESKSYSVTIQAGMTGCNIDSTINDNRDANTAGGLTSSAITGASNWAASTLHANTGSNSWRANDVAAVTNFVLTSPTFTVGNLSILSLSHYFNTESSFDGGIIEISTTLGVSWQDAGPYIIQNPYNTTMDASSGIGANKAFSGSSFDKFQRTILDLSSFSGQSLKIRFRMVSDDSNPATFDGWFLDDIILANGCGGILKTVLFNSSNSKIDSVRVPVFIKAGLSSPLPLTLVSFVAKQAGQQVLLSWLTANEINTKEFRVERSNAGSNWTEIGLVPAKTQSGNDYQLYDPKPITGINYYRLKLVDKDQAFKYSQVRSVQFSKNGNTGFVIIPNPANKQATLHFDSYVKSPEIFIYDMNGKLLQSKTINGNVADYLLETSRLASGTYMITVRSSVSLTTQKLVIEH